MTKSTSIVSTYVRSHRSILHIADGFHRVFGGEKRLGGEVSVAERSEAVLQDAAQCLRPGIGVKPHRRPVVGDRDDGTGGHSLQLAERGGWLHEVEGGADRDQVEARRERAPAPEVHRAAPDPLDVLEALFSQGPLGLAEHVGLRVDSDGVLEERRELEQKGAGAAAKVEQPTAAAAPNSPSRATNSAGYARRYRA